MNKRKTIANCLRQMADEIEALPEGADGTIQFEWNRPVEWLTHTHDSTGVRECRAGAFVFVKVEYQCRPFVGSWE